MDFEKKHDVGRLKDNLLSSGIANNLPPFDNLNKLLTTLFPNAYLDTVPLNFKKRSKTKKVKSEFKTDSENLQLPFRERVRIVARIILKGVLT